MATALFFSPLEVNPTWTVVSSSILMRIVLFAFADRTSILTGSQRLRMRAFLNAPNNFDTGTENVRLLLAS